MSTIDLTTPGLGGGLRDVLRSRYLLKLLVQKELKVRYRGSVLGLLWSYVKPGVQFVVFWLVRELPEIIHSVEFFLYRHAHSSFGRRRLADSHYSATIDCL